MRVDELPALVRAGFYVALLATIAAADLLLDDLYGPLAVLLAFLFVVLPLAGRRFGRGRERIEHRPRVVVVVGFAAILGLLAAIEIALVPDSGLGPTFWTIAVLIPAFEFYGYAARREARRQQ